MRYIFHNWLKIGDLELIDSAGEDVGVIIFLVVENRNGEISI
jgi:hypothetical protein